MQITYLGHSSLLIVTAGKKLLVDPFISGNEKANGKIDINDLNPDYILVTHAHQDHTLDVEEIGKRNNSTVVSNFEIATYYENKGLKAHPMNHGGNWKFNFGSLKYVNAIHTSSFPDGTYGGQPGGFILSSEGKQIYIAGDTALTMDMKLIPMSFKLDLAVLPIGDNFTMGIDEAITASNFIECNKIMGCHYDTFGYIKIDHTEAVQKFFKAEKELRLLEIGESIMV
ncbi:MULTISPECIES: metal-dependent hydrolase [unclassified Arenibacter]|jgi:L-ascorbate metabolism protein UlaG (beta-lactamase superfamily)|uniref:metal-dependent hydrolase n=1 Tax=unclassified Arenibacter TaxID=2615047 RepID=UPI000E3436B3|nr:MULTISPECIES: metal-dependent hydrolase [unclassified Arenibacter]MCM4162878.1 metal-dependent hydrolase [Arenibacter sp. A80]RFT56927.1 metal-dependent hydrolase [Arenibacter sp. P308M17]